MVPWVVAEALGYDPAVSRRRVKPGLSFLRHFDIDLHFRRGLLEARPGTVAVTRRGKPVLAIMSWEDYEAILETLEILSDEHAVEQLRRSIREVKEGKTIPWEEAKARLGA